MAKKKIDAKKVAGKIAGKVMACSINAIRCGRNINLLCITNDLK